MCFTNFFSKFQHFNNIFFFDVARFDILKNVEAEVFRNSGLVLKFRNPNGKLHLAWYSVKTILNDVSMFVLSIRWQ